MALADDTVYPLKHTKSLNAKADAKCLITKQLHLHPHTPITCTCLVLPPLIWFPISFYRLQQFRVYRYSAAKPDSVHAKFLPYRYFRCRVAVTGNTTHGLFSFFPTFHFQARSKNCETRLVAPSSMSVRPSVCLSARNSAPTGWIFMKFDVWAFFKYPSKKFKFH